MKRASTSWAVALVAISSCTAFHSLGGGRQPLRLRPGYSSQHYQPSVAPRGDVSVGLFRDLLKKIKGGDDDEDKDSKAADNAAAVGSDEKEDDDTPFVVDTYLASLESKPENAEAPIAESAPIVESGEKSEPAPIEAAATVEVEVVKEEKVELSPSAQAEKLRAQAARIRLEADKRQVELTLDKIAKLNKKLEKMKAQDTVNAKDQKSLEDELQMLKSQLITDEQGEIKPKPVPVAVAAKSESSTSEEGTATTSTPSTPSSESISAQYSALSPEKMKERVETFEKAPEFMKVIVAKTLGFGVDADTPGAVDRLNATDIVQKLYEDELDYQRISTNPDFTNESEKENARQMIERAYEKSGDGKDKDDGDKPKFTEEQIQAKVKELNDVPKFIKNMIDKDFNDTEMAERLLEEEYYEKKKGGGFFGGLFGSDKDKDKGEIGIDGERIDNQDSGTFKRWFEDDSSLNGTSYGDGGEPTSDLSFMMESLYPKSTRKEDETPSKKQVDAFLNDVVVPTKAFMPNSNPISVPGGWIIRGKNQCKSGDELIDKLDRRIANDARLREKISFFVLKDPFPNPEEQMLDPLNWPQVLFVAGPDVARESAVILRTAISSFGIATAWYGSIYPFLANSKLLDRATEAMELADAGMQTDLSWLSEMSIPLFASFMALQLVHDFAHQAVAKSKGFEANIPTLVPSVLSGITNSITSLKTPPKNKQDLVDFAVAGPLAGMIGSILLLCYGLVLTATADAATVQSFPGLPLVILRQSSLGGGLIDIFLGNGVLNVPASEEAARALASTLIALHPLAVAGFFSLVVNALALVPAGRTDGGRISMALFGRSGSQAVTFASLAALAILGFAGSDLLLFYFAYITFFQSELEIPMRNEVDDVDFSRVLLASFAGFLMLLTLIPMN